MPQNVDFSLVPLGEIRVLGAPQEEAPSPVHDKEGDWLGVVIPCLYFVEASKDSPVIINRRIIEGNSYIVFQEMALSALGRKRALAAHLWRESGYPQHEGDLFSFVRAEVEVIKPVLYREEFSQRFLELFQK